jgi:hypothetical protein
MNYNDNILHPAWVTGFIDGEGTFYCGINPKSDIKLGFQVTLEFVITHTKCFANTKTRWFF